jgi:hypothetical protein
LSHGHSIGLVQQAKPERAFFDQEIRYHGICKPSKISKNQAICLKGSKDERNRMTALRRNRNGFHITNAIPRH